MHVRSTVLTCMENSQAILNLLQGSTPLRRGVWADPSSAHDNSVQYMTLHEALGAMQKISWASV